MILVLDALIVALLAVAASVGGVIVVRRKVPVDVLRRQHDVAAAIFGVMGTLYAVLLGFTVVVVWNHYTDASNATDAESTHLGDLARVTESDKVRAVVDRYRRVVIDTEWPAMERGAMSPVARSAFNALWAECRAVKPSNAREETLYTESMRQLVAISDARRARLHAVNDDVPPLMWIVLIGGAIVVIGFTYLFAPERTAIHAIMVGALTAVIVMNLLLVQALDNPFNGWPHIEAEAMQAPPGTYLPDSLSNHGAQ